MIETPEKKHTYLVCNRLKVMNFTRPFLNIAVEAAYKPKLITLLIA